MSSVLVSMVFITRKLPRDLVRISKPIRREGCTITSFVDCTLGLQVLSGFSCFATVCAHCTKFMSFRSSTCALGEMKRSFWCSMRPNFEKHHWEDIGQWWNTSNYQQRTESRRHCIDVIPTQRRTAQMGSFAANGDGVVVTNRK